MKRPHSKPFFPLVFEAEDPRLGPLEYHAQVIATPDGRAHGYELLYRGASRGNWVELDRALLTHLGQHALSGEKLFINLSNEALMTLRPDVLIGAAHRNDIIFELSEAHDALNCFVGVADKVDYLTRMGLQFAIDDFGSGRDGLHRLYSLKRVAYIKVDGIFLGMCMQREDAGQMLQSLIARWRQDGMLVVAEWIESSEMRMTAINWGFDLLQGWHIDKLAAQNKPVGQDDIDAKTMLPVRGIRRAA